MANSVPRLLLFSTARLCCRTQANTTFPAEGALLVKKYTIANFVAPFGLNAIKLGGESELQTNKARHFASGSDPASSKSSWLPSWMSSLGSGGGGEGLEEIDLDQYAKYGKRMQVALRVKAMTGDKSADAVCKMWDRFEKIIGVMKPEQKAKSASLGKRERAQIAAAAGCSAAEVEECLNSHAEVRKNAQMLNKRRERGKELPTTMEGMKSLLAEMQRGAGGAPPRTRAPSYAPTSTKLPEYRAPDGSPCPLVAGSKPAARNEICPITQKKFKRCCGLQR